MGGLVIDALEFDGRVVIITGGGRGFGKAFGHAFAQRGGNVVLADIDERAAQLAAAEIEADGGQATAMCCDVADETQVEAMFEAISERFGGVDILINNAGLHSVEFSVAMATTGVARLRRLFDVNVMGVIICSLAAGPLMAGRPGACIINISSVAGYGCPTAYGVSKLAVQGLTMTSARELGPLGVRVNAIAPGLILTDTIRAELPKEIIDVVSGQQIIAREGAESDIVEAALYLCSERAAFVTGETLRVSGGFTLQI